MKCGYMSVVGKILCFFFHIFFELSTVRNRDSFRQATCICFLVIIIIVVIVYYFSLNNQPERLIVIPEYQYPDSADVVTETLQSSSAS